MSVEKQNRTKGHSLVLIDILREEKFERFAEVGVWKSGTTKRILRTIPNLIKEYWAIDPWQLMPHGSRTQRRRTEQNWHDYYKYCCSLMQFFPQLRVVKLTSEEAAEIVPDGYFDMVYIDADHSFEHVYADIGFWLPKVRPGGLLSGHDYGSRRWKGVKEAVDKWFGAENIKYWDIDEVWVKRI
jgi:hypothetical protein